MKKRYSCSVLSFFWGVDQIYPELGAHTLFIGEVTEVGGEPAEVLRMEDTRMNYGG